MDEEKAQYSYQGQTFTSKEAMDLYRESRGATAKNYADFGTPAKKRIVWQYVAFGFIALVATSCIFQSKSPIGVPSTSVTRPAPPGLSEDSKTIFATLINLHGELCAQVIDVNRIAGDFYRVSCTRYRDGTGSATYEVNAATGVVK